MGVDGELLFNDVDVHYGTECKGEECSSTEAPKRLAVLPFIVGQKYTIGKYFTSREEQGELIFFHLDGISENKDGHCVITCGESDVDGDDELVSGFYLKPLNGSFVSINGQELSEERRLSFGDEIKLGKHPDKVVTIYFMARLDWFDSEQEKRLCFLCRETVTLKRHNKYLGTQIEYLTSKLESYKSIRLFTQEGKDNSLIIDKIMSYLPTLQDIKQARLVSKAWAEEGKKHLRKKSQIHFDLLKCHPYHPSFQWKRNLFLYHHEIKGMIRHDSVMIKLPHSERYDEDEAKHTYPAKIRADFDEFFIGIGIRHLTLSRASVSTVLDLTTVMRILEKTGPTLETLDIYLDPANFYVAVKTGKVDPEAVTKMIQFPKLMVLKFTSTDPDYNTLSEEVFASTYQKWLQICQNLINIPKKLETLLIYGSTPPIFKMFMQSVEKQHLKELTLGNVDGDVDALSWSPQIGQAILEGFKESQLVQLRLTVSYLEGLEEASILSQILRKHSQSLEDLSLNLPSPTPTSQIAVPSMPNLMKLWITCYNIQEDGVPVTFPDSRAAQGVLIYSDYFPKLTTLTVDLCSIPDDSDDYWANYPQFMQPFFHLEQTCSTVVDLDCPYFWEEEGRHHNVNRLTKGVNLKGLKDLFPKVKFPVIDAAVGGWKDEVLDAINKLKDVLEGPPNEYGNEEENTRMAGHRYDYLAKIKLGLQGLDL